jgi:hypothetical protein
VWDRTPAHVRAMLALSQLNSFDMWEENPFNREVAKSAKKTRSKSDLV